MRGHVSRQLARYHDGEMPPREQARIAAHLASCARCRADYEEIAFAAGLMRGMAVAGPPPAVWNGIAARLDAPPVARRTWSWRLAALPAAAALALVVAGYWAMTGVSARPWEVARLDGKGPVRLAEGEWVDTGTGSPARITVGTIGTVDVAPGTRVQLGDVRGDQYRLTLARGTISAEIAAPPRLFFVDTPAATVVDLGCAYTVSVDDTGAGVLRVTEGWASLEVPGRESLIPAGARATVRTATGPGTPYFEDASPAMRSAVDAFDAGGDRQSSLAIVLAESRVRDTLTLWHLLSRADGELRAGVFDRIARLTTVPADVARAQVLALDADALRRLREELAWTW